MATLAMLGLVVACMLTFSSLMRLQVDRVELQTHRKLARQNARVALDLALAQLQRHTGTDRVITLPAATLLDTTPSTLEVTGVEHPYWTLALHVPSGTSTWLVSGASQADPQAPLSDEEAIRLVGPGSADPTEPDTWVYVPRVQLPELHTTPGSETQGFQAYAYWIGELNTRASLALTDPLSDHSGMTVEQRSFLQLSQQRRSALEAWHSETPLPDSDNVRDQMARTEVDAQLFFLNQNREALRKSYHDVTTRTYSVLSNSIDGGLKVNLTDPDAEVLGFTPQIRDALQPRLDPNSEALRIPGDDPDNAFPINGDLPAGQLISHTPPILTEFCLSMGIFHTQSDRRHRLRYHLHSEWLNPYPHEMGFRSKRPFLILVDQLPRLEVLNESSGEGFIVDLNAFNPDFRYNDPSQSKIHAWMEFDRLSTSPRREATYGIDAGQVYRMSEPDKVRQPQGLARTLQEAPNLWRWGGAQAPEAGAREPNRIYGDDVMRIRSLDPVRLRLSVLPLSNEARIPDDQHPDSFAEQSGALLQFKNIAFPDIDLRLSGSNYSRSTSGSFNPNDYRLAFHFKLNERDARIWQTLSEAHSLRDTQIDFADTLTRSVYEIFDAAAAARSSDPLTEQERFWDDSDRTNSNPPNAEAWQFFLYDIPLWQPVSAAALSQLHFHDYPHPWIGSPRASHSPLNGIWDRAFFSGSALRNYPTHSQVWNSKAAHVRRFQNLRLVPLPDKTGTFPDESTVTSAIGAAHCLMEGGFNLFSASPLAWMITLKHAMPVGSLPGWISSDAGSPSIPNTFARLPHAAAYLHSGRSDSTLPDEQRNRMLYRQAVRALDGVPGDADIDLRALAEQIVLEIRQAVASAPSPALPIHSLQDFINLGIIEQAITNTQRPGDGRGLNHDAIEGTRDGDIDPLNPGFLRQSDVLARVGSQLTTRSDSFVVRCYGESAGEGSSRPIAQAWAEAVVQRIPEYVRPEEPAHAAATHTANVIEGRRYRILHFRWLQPHEI